MPVRAAPTLPYQVIPSLGVGFDGLWRCRYQLDHQQGAGDHPQGVAAAVRAGQGQPRDFRVGGGSHRAAPLEAGAAAAGERVRIAEVQAASRAGGL